MSPPLHLALFVLLPLVLAARLLVPPRPALLEVTHGVLRFCLGFAKTSLLVLPLWHLSALVVRGGPASLSVGVAWMGLLALMLSQFFLLTSLADWLAGLGGMLGLRVPEALQETLNLRRFTGGGKLMYVLPLMLGLAVLSLVLQTLPAGDTWSHVQALYAAPPRSVASAFQEARVWSDYHVITLLAGLACFLALPHSRDFLRQPERWKAVLCLSLFALAIALYWTRNSPVT